MRRLRREELRRLTTDEPGLSHRQLARRLGVSKDTVRRDLEALAHEEERADAPQVSEGGADEDAPAGASGDAGAPTEDAPDATGAPLPRRVAQPLADMDVSQWRALRRDLAVLALTGRTAEAMVHQAVVALAHCYRQALARGELEHGQPFLVSGMTLRPLAPAADRPAS
jgi:DNA-binding transcriptional MocR family regulator